MGNKSYLRVDSNEYSLIMDFRNKKERSIRITKPFSNKIVGTRFGILLIDGEFNVPEDRSIPDAFIDEQLHILKRKGVI